MTSSRSSVVAAWLLLSCAAAAQQVFTGGTDTVILSVTVTAADSKLVGGLTRADFQVMEDGVLQDIGYFSTDRQPIALSLLLDSSTSMETKLPIAQEAAIGFVRTLRPNDMALVLDFDTHQEILQGFTADRGALEAAIRRPQASGSTTLYDALYVALTELRMPRAQNNDEIRRRAIIVLSDGEDTTSIQQYEDVLDLSKRTDAAVYAIGLRSKEPMPMGHGFNEADFVLRTLSQETGGRAFFVTEAAQLAGIYRQIADELANQYTLAYSPRNAKHDGTWRRINVRITNGGAIARTKSGYFASGKR